MSQQANPSGNNPGKERKKLFLLDAYALIFRAFYAFIKNPRINSKGLDTSAVFGFLNTLMDIIRREKPHYLAVAFDKGKSIERTELYEDYKANRLETPEGIKVAVPYIHELLKAMHIPVIELEGWEADDLIGTLAKQAEKEGFEVYMVTADKDFAQLVDDHIFLYKPSRMGNGIEIWDKQKVKEKFGVEHPEQVIDFLGMMGDSVDNIPGLPGVGEKTAKKFLAEFGSIENLLNNTDKLKGKMKEKVEANKELGLLSKKLATINTEAPIRFDAETYQLDTPDFEKVNKLFKELEFRRIAEQFNRLFRVEDTSATAVSAGQKTVKKSNPKQYSLFDDFFGEGQQTESKSDILADKFYQLADSPKAKEILHQKLMNQSGAAMQIYPDEFNFENNAYYWFTGFNPGKIYQVDMTRDLEQNLLLFRDFFTGEQLAKSGYDIKQIYKLLQRHHIELKGDLIDIMLIHYLLNPEMRNELEILSENYLNIRLEKPDKKTAGMQEYIEYFAKRTDVILRLKKQLLSDLEQSGAKELYDKIEAPLLKVLGDMELAGIKLDTGILDEIRKKLETEIHRLEKEIYEIAGEIFNIGSPKQLGIVLFEKLQIDSKPKKTKTGQYSTSEEVLSKYQDQDIIRKILDWRSLTKLKSTYVDSLPKQINPVTGRIHTHFNQNVTATGRLSSTDPNLQNIPIRTKWGKEIRKAFVAETGNVLVSADYSQIELRLIASFSGDKEMLQAFKNGEDIHRATAAKVFGIPLEKVTGAQRSHAKSVNYGIIYGLSAHGLSQQTGLSRSESKQLIDTYFDTYPTLKDYIKKQVDFAREHGYVETILGRRRYLKDIHSRNAVVRAAAERNAVNAPLQGSAADIIKKAMIDIQNEIKGKYQTQMLLQVHDELVFEVPENELDAIKNIIRNKMENVVALAVPLTVDIGVGKNWFEAH
jgi:DNA polymerase-1